MATDFLFSSQRRNLQWEIPVIFPAGALAIPLKMFFIISIQQIEIMKNYAILNASFSEQEKIKMAIGILFLVFTAIVWVVLGAVVSYAANKNLNLGFIQGAGAIVLAVLTLPIYFLKDLSVPPIVLISVFLSGLGNYMAFILMNKAMQKGPNGLVWAMIQSAFALPFLMGILVFKVPCPATRTAGLIFLIAAMILMGVFGKNDKNGNEKHGAVWILFSVLGFLVAGATQCCANIPSYLIKGDDSGIWTALFRAGLSSAGIFTAFFVHGLIKRETFNGKGCGKSTVIMTISIVLSLVFTFIGLDRLAKYNAGAIAYPMIVGISIAIFMIYTAIRLKEKLSFPALCGVLLCLAGIIVIAI